MTNNIDIYELERIVNSAKDPVYFMENIKMKNTYGEIVKFQEFQKEFIEHIHSHSNTIVLKSRQMYVTTMLANYVAWNMIFNKKKCAYISHDISSGEHFKKMVLGILINYNNMFFNADKQIVTNNKKMLQLESGGYLKCVGSSVISLRASRIDIAIMDEFCVINNNEEAMLSTFPYVLNQKDTRFIIATSISKNYDKNKTFKKIWNDANNNSNDFKPTLIHWSKNELYDQEWFETECSRAGYDSDWIATELECIFPQEKKKQEVVSFRLDEDIMQKINQKLKKEDLKISDYLRELILKDLKI